MRIDRIRIGSYGGLRENVFELQPGLNVFYGHNEAGKSTIRSFVTACMFPKCGLRYPTPKGSDSGTLEVTLQDGRRLLFERDGRKCSGLGSELCGIDDKEYITIYSMSPEDLRDVKGIEKGDIRNRFLTIPGGADLPKAYEELDEERLSLLPDAKRSAKCGIALLIQEEHSRRQKVRELQARESGDANYAMLVSRRNELETRLKVAKTRMDTADAVRIAGHKAEGRSDSLARIAELESRERELLYSSDIDPTKLAVLDREVENAASEAERKKRYLDAVRVDFGGISPEAIARNRSKIEYLRNESVNYEYYRQRIEYRSKPAAPIKSTGNGFPLITVAGAVAAATGLAVAIVAEPLVGAGIAVLGLIIIFAGLRKRKDSREPVQKTADDDPDTTRLRYIEEILDGVTKDCGIPRRGFTADVAMLVRLADSASAYRKAAEESEDAEQKRKDAISSRDLFLTGYGGRARFEQGMKDQAELQDVRSKLEVLRESVSATGDTDIDTETAEREYAFAHEEYLSANREYAEVVQSLKDISDDMTVEDAITEWSEADSAVYAASYRWARLMIERMILDGASEAAYGSRRPDVLTRADAYLSEMTSGRYRMNTDPRVTELSVLDSDGCAKTAKEWSSGLEDQVKLSVKMAVSLSLSHERPPFILDDVLLTSDSIRKEGACRAISLFSDDIQVLYFTCDRESRDLMEKAGAKVVDL